jgi:hypothetical protein
MNNSLQSLYTSKVFQLTLVITLLWTFLDANNRFNTDLNNKAVKGTSFVVEQLKGPQITEEEIDAIFQLFPKKLPEETLVATDIKNKGMSELEQYLQTGDLERLYVGEHLLTLKAIITADSKSNAGKVMSKNANLQQALILVKSVDGDGQQIEKYSHGDDVYGFTLEIESNKRVILTREVNVDDYQKITKNDNMPINENGQQHIQKIALTLYKAN